jgi:hypothetical protein
LATDLLVERFFDAFNVQQTTTATNGVVTGEERPCVGLKIIPNIRRFGKVFAVFGKSAPARRE